MIRRGGGGRPLGASPWISRRRMENAYVRACKVTWSVKTLRTAPRHPDGRGFGLVGRPRWPSHSKQPDHDRPLGEASWRRSSPPSMASARSPANKEAALKTLGKSVQRLGLTAEAVLAAAPGLLDGRLDADGWRTQLTKPPAPQRRASTAGRSRRGARARPPPLARGHQGGPADRHAAPGRARGHRPGGRGHRVADRTRSGVR